MCIFVCVLYRIHSAVGVYVFLQYGDMFILLIQATHFPSWLTHPTAIRTAALCPRQVDVKSWQQHLEQHRRVDMFSLL